MSAYRQLPLALGHRPALSAEDFLVAAPNREAVAWIDRWPDWPTPALVIHGPPGCGKTHLARVFMALSGAAAVSAETLGSCEPPTLPEGQPAAVVEDIEDLIGAGLEEPLLHLYNGLQASRRHLLVTAGRAPAHMAVALADLGSRLRAALAVGIGAPDDAVIAAVMVKLFADRQLRIGDEVIAYLLARMERSFDAARRLVAALDEASLAEHRRITVPLVRQVLARVQQQG